MNRKELVVILSITFFVVMVWIIADILHSRPSVQLDPKIQDLIQPINTSFDQATLSQINSNFQNRTSAPLPQPTAQPLTPTPPVTPTPLSSPLTSLPPLPVESSSSASESANIPNQ